MPDDPLFDPWSTRDAPAVDEPAESPTAESAADATPMPRGPLPGQPAQAESERIPSRWRSAPRAVERARPVPPPAPSGPETVEPETVEPGTTATERLQDAAVPYLKALEARLQIARHRTLLDERLDRAPPTIRFRLIPRRGPFDDVSAVPGAVLEILAADSSSVTARFWLDPVAEEPTEERATDVDRLGPAWIDEVTMDFVQRALRRA